MHRSIKEIVPENQPIMEESSLKTDSISLSRSDDNGPLSAGPSWERFQIIATSEQNERRIMENLESTQENKTEEFPEPPQNQPADWTQGRETFEPYGPIEDTKISGSPEELIDEKKSSKVQELISSPMIEQKRYVSKESLLLRSGSKTRTHSKESTKSNKLKKIQNMKSCYRVPFKMLNPKPRYIDNDYPQLIYELNHPMYVPEVSYGRSAREVGKEKIKLWAYYGKTRSKHRETKDQPWYRCDAYGRIENRSYSPPVPGTDREYWVDPGGTLSSRSHSHSPSPRTLKSPYSTGMSTPKDRELTPRALEALKISDDYEMTRLRQNYNNVALPLIKKWMKNPKHAPQIIDWKDELRKKLEREKRKRYNAKKRKTINELPPPPPIVLDLETEHNERAQAVSIKMTESLRVVAKIQTATKMRRLTKIERWSDEPEKIHNNLLGGRLSPLYTGSYKTPTMLRKTQVLDIYPKFARSDFGGEIVVEDDLCKALRYMGFHYNDVQVEKLLRGEIFSFQWATMDKDQFIECVSFFQENESSKIMNWFSIGQDEPMPLHYANRLTAKTHRGKILKFIQNVPAYNFVSTATLISFLDEVEKYRTGGKRKEVSVQNKIEPHGRPTGFLAKLAAKNSVASQQIPESDLERDTRGTVINPRETATNSRDTQKNPEFCNPLGEVHAMMLEMPKNALPLECIEDEYDDTMLTWQDLEGLRSRLQYSRGFSKQEILEYGTAYCNLSDFGGDRLMQAENFEKAFSYMNYSLEGELGLCFDREEGFTQENFLTAMVVYRNIRHNFIKSIFDKYQKAGFLRIYDIMDALKDIHVKVGGECIRDALNDLKIDCTFQNLYTKPTAKGLINVIKSNFLKKGKKEPEEEEKKEKKNQNVETKSINCAQFVALVDTIRAKDELTWHEIAELKEIFGRFGRTQKGQRVIECSVPVIRKVLRALGYVNVDLNFLNAILLRANPHRAHYINFFELRKIIQIFNIKILENRRGTYNFFAQKSTLKLASIRKALISAGEYWEGDDVLNKAINEALGNQYEACEKEGLTIHHFIYIASILRERMRGILASNYGFTANDLQGLDKMFKSYVHVNSDNTIKGRYFSDLLKYLFPSESRQALENIVAMVDKDHSQELDYEEFLDLMRYYNGRREEKFYKKELKAIRQSKFSDSEVQEFRIIFQSFDLDQSGTIDIDECIQLIEQITRLTMAQKKELIDIMYEKDTKDTKIENPGDHDFPEFLLLIRRLVDDDFAQIVTKSNFLASSEKEKSNIINSGRSRLTQTLTCLEEENEKVIRDQLLQRNIDFSNINYDDLGSLQIPHDGKQRRRTSLMDEKNAELALERTSNEFHTNKPRRVSAAGIDRKTINFNIPGPQKSSRQASPSENIKPTRSIKSKSHNPKLYIDTHTIDPPADETDIIEYKPKHKKKVHRRSSIGNISSPMRQSTTDAIMQEARDDMPEIPSTTKARQSGHMLLLQSTKSKIFDQCVDDTFKNLGSSKPDQTQDTFKKLGSKRRIPDPQSPTEKFIAIPENTAGYVQNSQKAMIGIYRGRSSLFASLANAKIKLRKAKGRLLLSPLRKLTVDTIGSPKGSLSPKGSRHRNKKDIDDSPLPRRPSTADTAMLPYEMMEEAGDDIIESQHPRGKSVCFADPIMDDRSNHSSKEKMVLRKKKLNDGALTKEMDEKNDGAAEKEIPPMADTKVDSSPDVCAVEPVGDPPPETASCAVESSEVLRLEEKSRTSTAQSSKAVSVDPSGAECTSVDKMTLEYLLPTIFDASSESRNTPNRTATPSVIVESSSPCDDMETISYSAEETFTTVMKRNVSFAENPVVLHSFDQPMEETLDPEPSLRFHCAVSEDNTSPVVCGVTVDSFLCLSTETEQTRPDSSNMISFANLPEESHTPSMIEESGSPDSRMEPKDTENADNIVHEMLEHLASM